MNACEDQSEPLGEHIDTFSAIQRGAVLGILSTADEVLATKQLAERQTVALNKVRELHDRWAKAETWDGRPHIVSHAYALELAVALGIEAGV